MATPEQQQQEEQKKQQQQALYKTKQKNLSISLEKFKGSITQALPKHISAETMIRTVLTEASKTPAILDCTLRI